MGNGTPPAGELPMTWHTFGRKWTRLWTSTPGRRFQNFYRRIHRNHAAEDVTTHIVRFGLAVIFLCVGIILILLPLVYIPFLIASAALFASESVTFARFLDRSETWCRRSWARIKASLGITPLGSQIIAGVLSVGCIGMAGFAAYRTFMK
jgi:uncharacterized membrane protein YbaN (DUF454 family)